MSPGRAAGGLVRRLIDANVRLSRATERWLGLPTDKTLWQAFGHEVHELIRAQPSGATIVDLGGGRRCVFHHALRPDLELVAVDIDAHELALNEYATRKVVADVSRELPLPDGSVDLLVSRALLEHVEDVGAAIHHMARVLKPGARTLHLVPARYSLFGIAARLVPFKPLARLVHTVMPWTIDEVGFRVHYDRGWPAAMDRTFRQAGFREVKVDVTWAQPGYFEAVYPLFLGQALYEALVRRLNVQRLASYMVVQAVR